MKILSWNCRGLGNPPAVRALLRLIRLENPICVFLMETRLKSFEMEGIKQKCGFNSCLAVDCRGTGKERAGGLALLWRDPMKLTVSSYSLNHIGGHFIDGESDQHCHFSCIYGFPEECNKKKTWKLIEELGSSTGNKWVCFGDLNDIISSNEKMGGNTRNPSQLMLGRNTLDNCSLIDLGFEGHPFTWTNKRELEENIQCRLDRAVATEEFISRFSPIRVLHLPRYGSDHAPILIDLESDFMNAHKKRTRLFRFEEAWTKEANSEDTIRNVWNGGGFNLPGRINGMQHLGSSFEGMNMGSIKKEIKRIEKILCDSNLWSSTHADLIRFKTLEKQLDDLLKTEEVMWRQRSRAVWLMEGDKNTKFFHGKANQRRKTNEIKKLKDSDGVWWRGEEHVERILIDHFSDIFSSSNPVDIEEVCEVVRGKLNSNHREVCASIFMRHEVKDAIFQMHPLKAPGPDGLPALFFQKYWHIVGGDVLNYALDVLNNGRNPEDMNKTFIALIPKCKNPTSPKDFRPISLCNVVMKIVTKTIANRLKQVLPE